MQGSSLLKRDGYGTILAAFDGSEGSAQALRRALLVAEKYSAKVTVLSVDEHVPRYAAGVGEVDEVSDLRREHFDELKRQALEIASECGASIDVETRVGHAAQIIVQVARDGGFGLVVVGQRGHSGLWGALTGSTTARVVDHAPCDVLVVK